MELADPQGSYAVLIGTAAYSAPTLEDLPAVAQNLDGLGRLLEDPSVWGLPPERCTRLVDPATSREFLDAVREGAQRATDTLVVYYAGHGLRAPDVDGLLLALSSTDPERPYTCVDFDAVRREVLEAGRKVNKVVILDCCYGGVAMAGGMGGPDGVGESRGVTVAEQTRIAGSYLLTACAANRQALSPPGERHTAFTGELIRLLDRGVPGAGPLIGAPALYDHLLGELRAKGLPLPQQRLSNTGRSLAFVRNRHGLTDDPRRAAGPSRHATTVPERLRDALRAQPRALAEHAARLRQTDADAAAELLELAAATRPAQEVATLVWMLREQGRTDEADTVLTTAAAQRTPDDLAAALSALHALDDGDDGDDGDDDGDDATRLRRAIARRAPEDVAGTLRALRAAGRKQDVDAVLAVAVDRLHTTEKILGLAGALWSAQLDEEAQRVLAAASTSSPRETVRLAQALVAIERVTEALDLYRQPAVLVTLSPEELVRVLQVMEESGHRADAGGLLHAAVDAFTTVEGTAALCEALWAAGMDDRCSVTLERAAEALSVDGVGALAEALHARGHEGSVLQLFTTAALRRPVARTPELVIALRSMGRPLDAERLLRDAATRSDQDVVELLVLLDGPAAVRDRARIVDVVLNLPLARLAEMALALHAAERPVADVLAPWLSLGDRMFVDALAALRAEHLDDAALLVLTHQVQTAPDAARGRLPALDAAHAALDGSLLRVLVRRRADPPPGDVEEPTPEAIRALVTGAEHSVDERVVAMAHLCEVGLEERVVSALADVTRTRSRVEVIDLLGRLEARGLTVCAHAIVDGARMFSELYRDFVRALLAQGLRQLAEYAVDRHGHRLHPAQRRELAAELGMAEPEREEQPPVDQPRTRRRLWRDRR
ncbi:caspase family protein [Streptomyces sp. NPDC047315]|uniref:caspase, EACC1-associated type n=1 Tax=Streptomyces sp. NPDC047315 TaxID=3155142 RepID=UPI00340FC5C8